MTPVTAAVAQEDETQDSTFYSSANNIYCVSGLGKCILIRKSTCTLALPDVREKQGLPRGLKKTFQGKHCLPQTRKCWQQGETI